MIDILGFIVAPFLFVTVTSFIIKLLFPGGDDD